MSLNFDDISVKSLPAVNRHLGAQVEARLDWCSSVQGTGEMAERKAREALLQWIYGDIEWLFTKYADRVEQHASAAETPGFRALRDDILKRLRGESPSRAPYQNLNKPEDVKTDACQASLAD